MLLGPGLVYVLTVLGGGDVVSNAAAGAGYGYSLIWTLGITLVFRFVWVDISAKYVLVTGESLLQGYARVGKWVIWTLLIALIVVGHSYNLYAIVMIGSAADLLFHLPTEWGSVIWSFSFTCVGFAMMYWGGYRLIEVFVKILIAAMGASLIVAALLSKPDSTAILRGMFIPTIPGAQGPYSAFFVVMALIGTGAGSITNMTYAYFIHEKGWRDLSYRKQQRFDLVFSVVCLFVMGALLQIAAAGTIGPQGIDLESAEDLGQIFSETQGIAGLIIFGLGLWGASFSTFVGNTAGFGLIVTDICRSFIPSLKKRPGRENSRQNTQRDPIYRWCVAFLSFSPLYIFFTGVSPVWLTLVVSSLVVVLIPLLTVALVKITNDEKLMGQYKNGWLTNAVMIGLVLVAVYLMYRNAVDLWDQWI